MTNQETFDIVVKAIRKQGRQSVDRTGGCVYRAKDENGTVTAKCAAGHLIPDDKYCQHMESTFCTDGDVADVLREEGHDPSFVRLLQRCHDAASGGFVENFLVRCRVTAKSFDLSDAACDEELV